jgi:hypothetical protein
MNIEYAKTPKWANAEKTQIDLIIKVSHLGMEVPFTATPDDIEEYGRDIFKRALFGEYGEISEYAEPVIPEPTIEQNKIRAIELLQETDWVNQPDVVDKNINPHLLNYEDFKIYRAAIRAIAVNPQSGNLVWPTKPVERWS